MMTVCDDCYIWKPIFTGQGNVRSASRGIRVSLTRTLRPTTLHVNESPHALSTVEYRILCSIGSRIGFTALI